MHDAFISYSTKDKALAERLVAGLESAGVRCWIAPRNIPRGEKWAEQIVKAIEATPVFLLVFTSHSNESDDVGREVGLAVKTKSHVIPVRFENVEFCDNLEYYLTVTQWCDATGAFDEPEIRALAERVLAIRARTRGGDAGAMATATAPNAGGAGGGAAGSAAGGSSGPDITVQSNPATVTPLKGRRWEKDVRVEFGPRAAIAVGILVLAISAAIVWTVFKLVNPKPGPGPETPQTAGAGDKGGAEKGGADPGKGEKQEAETATRTAAVVPEGKALGAEALAAMQKRLDGYQRRRAMVYWTSPSVGTSASAGNSGGARTARVGRKDYLVSGRSGDQLAMFVEGTADGVAMRVLPSGVLLFRGTGLPGGGADDAVMFELDEKAGVRLLERGLIGAGTEVWSGMRAGGEQVVIAFCRQGSSPASSYVTGMLGQDRTVPVTGDEGVTFDAICGTELEIAASRATQRGPAQLTGVVELSREDRGRAKSPVTIFARCTDEQNRETVAPREIATLSEAQPSAKFSVEVPASSGTAVLEIRHGNPGKIVPVWGGVRFERPQAGRSQGETPQVATPGGTDSKIPTTTPTTTPTSTPTSTPTGTPTSAPTGSPTTPSTSGPGGAPAVNPDPSKPAGERKALGAEEMAELSRRVAGYARRLAAVVSVGSAADGAEVQIARKDFTVLGLKGDRLTVAQVDSREPVGLKLTPAGVLEFKGAGLPSGGTGDLVEFEFDQRTTRILIDAGQINAGTEIWSGQRQGSEKLYIAFCHPDSIPASSLVTGIPAEARRVPVTAKGAILFDASSGASLGVPVGRATRDGYTLLNGVVALSRADAARVSGPAAITAVCFDDVTNGPLLHIATLRAEETSARFSVEVPKGTQTVQLAVRGENVTPVWGGVRFERVTTAQGPEPSAEESGKPGGPAAGQDPRASRPGAQTPLSEEAIRDLYKRLDGYSKRLAVFYFSDIGQGRGQWQVMRKDLTALGRIAGEKYVFGAADRSQLTMQITPAGALEFKGAGLPGGGADDDVKFVLDERLTKMLVDGGQVHAGTEVWSGARGRGERVLMAICHPDSMPASALAPSSEARSVPVPAKGGPMFDVSSGESQMVAIGRMKQAGFTRLTGVVALSRQDAARVKGPLTVYAVCYDEHKKETVPQREIATLGPEALSASFSIEVPRGTELGLLYIQRDNPEKFVPLWGGVRLERPDGRK